MVQLVDATREGEGDLLRRSNDIEQDYFTAKDRVGWLYPVTTPQRLGASPDVVPILARRVVRIEGFYATIQVKNFQLDPSLTGDCGKAKPTS